MRRNETPEYQTQRGDMTARLFSLDQRIKAAVRDGREDDAADLNDQYRTTVIAREALDARNGRRARRRAA